MQQPTILCVENEGSEFAVSKRVHESGNFRIITVTQSDTALKLLSVVKADAAVFDCRTLPQDGVAAAARMREIDATLPRFLVAPAENNAHFADRSGLLYVVNDLEVLAWQLQALLANVEFRHERQATLMMQSKKLRERGRGLSRDIRLGVNKAKSGLVSKPANGFKRITLSACQRCGALVGLSDRFGELEHAEQEHDCAAAERLRVALRDSHARDDCA